uniref:Integral membrane protein n=1 Tax=Streptomyces sp. NBC_00049 TaxID=2903617 RepID=A0AAU2K284_9ACTN
MTTDSVRVDGNALILGEGVQVRFIRTLRLPESGTHALPPGLGEFPLRRVEDYPDTVPPEWLAKGGVMLPVYLREAMWLSFGRTRRPAALQVGVGKVCAVSGERWTGRPARTPQNYVVLPRQPWLDGINSGDGTVRQFVAVPLGLGATVEGQVTGEETTGGVQLQAFPLGPEALGEWERVERERAERARQAGPRAGGRPRGGGGYGGPLAVPAPMAAGPAGSPARRFRRPSGEAVPPAAPAMGLGAGGSLRQQVYRDDRPLSDWAEEPAARVFVHLVTPPAWRRITGEAAPPSPADRAAYTKAGLPWFDYYDESAADLAPADALSRVKPVGEWLGDDDAAWVEPAPEQIKPLGSPPRPGKPVQDGNW